MVGSGGILIVIAAARDFEDGLVQGLLWPLTRAKIEAFATGGLRPVWIEDVHDAEQPTVRRWRPEFRRPTRTRSAIGAHGCRKPSGQERAESTRRRSADPGPEILKMPWWVQPAGARPRLLAVEPGTAKWLAGRGVEVDHVTLYRWVRRFAPLLPDAARPRWHAGEPVVGRRDLPRPGATVTPAQVVTSDHIRLLSLAVAVYQVRRRPFISASEKSRTA